MKQQVYFFVIVIVVLAAIVALLYALADNVPALALRVWAVVATLLVPSVSVAFYFFGRTEARGFLAGADRMIDRSMALLGNAMTQRDTSFGRRAREVNPMADPAVQNQMRALFAMGPGAPSASNGEVEL